jgi:hypothetical protein
VTPGLWVLGVVLLGVFFGERVQLAPLLAATPAIACAGTGRRQCVVLGCTCALFALAPLPGQPGALGERLGTVLAVLIVAAASYLVAQRRIRMQRAYDEVRRIADVTQRVLLRPVPEQVGPVAVAAEYLSAVDGARIGGDFYEIIATRYGIRAILGDVRGKGLDAVSGAAALLGAFREAGAVEPELQDVAMRLDAALARHASRIEPRETEPHEAESGPWAEDFATAVLLQIPWGLDDPHDVNGADSADDADGDGNEADTDAEVQLAVCGHPAPYLIHGGEAFALEPEHPTLPLGLGALAAEPYAAASRVIALEPGDALILYTDGISDARSRSGEFFPLDTAFCGLGGLSPNVMTGLVRERLLAHTRNGLNDDAALLILRREGAGDGRPALRPNPRPGRAAGPPDGETPVHARGAAW